VTFEFKPIAGAVAEVSDRLFEPAEQPPPPSGFGITRTPVPHR
jgi:hypothetical protein